MRHIVREMYARQSLVVYEPLRHNLRWAPNLLVAATRWLYVSLDSNTSSAFDFERCHTSLVQTNANDTTRQNAECLRHQSCLLYPDTEVRVLVVPYNNTVVLVSSRIGRTCTALRIKLPGGWIKLTIAHLNSSFKQLLSSLTHFAYPRYVFKDYWHHSPGS